MVATGTDTEARGLNAAIDEFRHAWRHLRDRPDRAVEARAARACPPRWVIERILRMAAAQRERAVAELAAQVRQILEDAEFAGVGDAPTQHESPPTFEAEVRLVVRTLETIGTRVVIEVTTVTPAILPPWVRC